MVGAYRNNSRKPTNLLMNDICESDNSYSSDLMLNRTDENIQYEPHDDYLSDVDSEISELSLAMYPTYGDYDKIHSLITSYLIGKDKTRICIPLPLSITSSFGPEVDCEIDFDFDIDLEDIEFESLDMNINSESDSESNQCK